MLSLKYAIRSPDSVNEVANSFRKKLKEKTKLTKITLKNAEKKKKPIDLFLVFFPVVSRTGTDIDAALSNIEDKKKPVLLVVLHHTFDPEAVLSDSRKFVNRENTCTVDCLFYEDKGLLDCKINDKAYKTAIEWLGSLTQNKKQKKGEQKGSTTNPNQL